MALYYARFHSQVHSLIGGQIRTDHPSQCPDRVLNFKLALIGIILIVIQIYQYLISYLHYIYYGEEKW